MKKIFLCLAAAAFSGYGLNAQRVCGTMENLQHQLSDHPGIQQRMMDIQEHTVQYEQQGNQTRAIVTIPVVVHVVYRTSTQNVSDAQVQSQITVLNNDFRKLNSDVSLVPSAFAGLAADMEFNFCLAQQTPAGAATNGINRIATTRTTSFGSNDAVKSASTGGTPGWDPNRYLNLWVCDIGGGILGYATFPGGATSTTDGVVIDYRYFGTTGTATAPFNKGRTGTHEVGHWFNLYHIWGDDGSGCSGSDLVSDTPNQADENYGCPAFPAVSCSNGPNGDMFMNYMDYSDDVCMYMFSSGQKTRAQALFSAGGAMAALLTSNGCQAPTVGTTCGIPAGLGASAITTTGATASWSAVSGAASYNLGYKLNTATTWTTVNTTSTSRVLTGLTASTAYNLRVQAVCAGSTGTYSATVNFTTATIPAGCSDVYESNNSISASKPIAVNTNITALIGTSTDKDYFQFSNSTATRNIKVTLNNLAADYDVRLYRGSSQVGISQNGGTTAETIIYNNGNIATYNVQVYGYGGVFNTTSCYTLRIDLSSSTFIRQAGEAEVSESETDDAFSVYPNPNNGVLNIRLQPESDQLQSVEVYNQLGQVVQKVNLNFTKELPVAELNLYDLQDGIYFVRVFDGTQVQTRKVLLRK